MRFVSLVALAGVVAAALVACSSSSGSGVPSPDAGLSEEDGSTVGPDGEPVPPRPDAQTTYVKTTTETFTHRGTQRKYILSVPVDYDASKKYPLFVFMHGNPGTAEGMLGAFPVDPATKKEAIVVYPNALGENWEHTKPNAQNPDMDYFAALIAEIEKKASIDKARILGSGWSGGGFMASQLACRFSGLFKAIGIHAGGAPYDLPENNPQYDADGYLVCPGGPIAAIVTHGAEDTGVTPDSGEYAGQYWAHKNGCTGGLVASSPDPCKKYAGCPASTPVTVCIVPTLGHPLWDRAHEVTWAWFKSLP